MKSVLWGSGSAAVFFSIVAVGASQGEIGIGVLLGLTVVAAILVLLRGPGAKSKAKVAAIALPVGLALGFLGQGLAQHARKIESLERDAAYRAEREKWLVGGTSMWKGSEGKPFNYNLRSWDAGKTWYAVEYTGDGMMTIKGEAESLYPGLVATIQAWDRLAKAAEATGGKGLDPMNPAHQALLSDAGFTVERKSP